MNDPVIVALVDILIFVILPTIVLLCILLVRHNKKKKIISYQNIETVSQDYVSLYKRADNMSVLKCPYCDCENTVSSTICVACGDKIKN